MSNSRPNSSYNLQNASTPGLSVSYTQAYTPSSQNSFDQTYRFITRLPGILWAFLVFNLIGDLYKLLTLKHEFITGELYERSKLTGAGIAYAGPPWLKGVPQIVVVSGPVSNAAKVADYGEGDHLDPVARKPVGDVINHILEGRQLSLFTMHGQQAMKERAVVKGHLNPDSMGAIFQFSRTFFGQWINEWDSTFCYQDFVFYLASNVVGQAVWGIGYVDKSLAHLLRRLGDFISTSDVDSQAFKDICRELNATGRSIMKDRTEVVMHARGYTYDQLPDDIKTGQRHATPDELRELIAGTHSVPGLVASDNFSKVLMSALAYINNDDAIVRRILAELEAHPEWKDNWQSLNQLPYLEAVYKEILRIMSPTSLVPRQTSRAFDLTVTGRDGVERTYKLPPNSRMFVPIRRINHDPDSWPNPHIFNPDRFLTGEGRDNKSHFIDKNFIPFSNGTRPCPAGAYFVPVVVKTLIALFFNDYRLQLDKPLEDIAVNAVTSKWGQEYHATLVPRQPENTLQLR